MKLFTIEEANETLTIVRPILEKIKARHAAIASLRDSAAAALRSASLWASATGQAEFLAQALR